MVLRQGIGVTQPWHDETQNLGQGFMDLFGRESGGAVPALLGIPIGADSDNTGGESLAWITSVSHPPIH